MYILLRQMYDHIFFEFFFYFFFMFFVKQEKFDVLDLISKSVYESKKCVKL